MTTKIEPTTAGVDIRRGATAFAASAALVHAGNYGFNLLLGRQLGPALFSELNLIVTLMLMITFAAATLQITAARYIAILDIGSEREQIRAWMLRRTMPVGVGLACALTLGAPILATVFRLTSAIPLVVFALGIPIYLAQAVHRGVVQGEARFAWLAASYQAEMWVRLGAGVLLVAFGWAVTGGAAALFLSFLASWLVVRRRPSNHMFPEMHLRREVGLFARASSILLAGEILISHSDLIVAKIAFEPVMAGNYAAISLIGRIAFFATWPVVAVLFPIAAKRGAHGLPTGHVLRIAVGIVTAVTAGLTIAAAAIPEQILTFAFGAEFAAAAPWLWPYVIASGLFAVANTIASYHLATAQAGGGRILLGGGIAQVVVIAFFHTSIAVLVWAQVVVMIGLLAITFAWHLRLGSDSQIPSSIVRPSPATT